MTWVFHLGRWLVGLLLRPAPAGFRCFWDAGDTYRCPRFCEGDHIFCGPHLRMAEEARRNEGDTHAT